MTTGTVMYTRTKFYVVVVVVVANWLNGSQRKEKENIVAYHHLPNMNKY